MHKTEESIASLLATHPRPTGTKAYTYGTAGFRMPAELMDPVALRVAIYAGCMGRTVGVMITASHNPIGDNGIKLVDSNGEMVGEAEEREIAWLANATDREVIDWASAKDRRCSRVVFGRDTRPSGERLLAVMRAGLEALGVASLDFGLATTPQLHHYVRSVAEGKASTVEQAAELYYAMLASPAKAVFKGHPPRVVVVDCANGVGAKAVKELNRRLNGLIQLDPIMDGSGTLNYECGADWVKTGQCPPKGLQGEPGVHYASLDGDADRIVLYYFDKEGRFHLLDGDRIAVLIATALKPMLSSTPLSLACIQTAYANGASTAFLAANRIQTVCTGTGVKNLHQAAKAFDVGVYFEANGHGTVLLSGRAKSVLSCDDLLGLINECVGDALSDLLLVEGVLAMTGLAIEEWSQQYEELPSVLRKVQVPDRLAIVTGDADRAILQPAGLQSRIDALVAQHPKGRAFARPSGTEDVVRVYAEAATIESAQSLANQVSELIRDTLM